MSMIGKTLGSFQCTALLGKGGMGEVYKAKDQKLGRDVAIKVLPEEFAKDADRVARFQREAKLLASLNHPNIAAIYGLEESDGAHFLVLELIEGDTLADRIKSGPIPVEESLKLALQIAEALEAAHEKGVIHRDLKPANIKVTPEGKVKVLDFGLAKAFAGDSEDMNLSNSPTLSVAATQQGVILGTAAYMSPEQARGKEVDKRADIWAFGIVLFEMLTGKQVFTGDTVSDTLASVLAREPEWQSLPQNLHPRIRLLLERCLKKDPRNRYGAISDARVDIQEVLADPSNILAQPVLSEESRTKFRTMIPWLVATLVLGAVIAGLAIWKLTAPDPPEVVRFDYELPKYHNFADESNPILDISPDGKQLVYGTSHGLYLRPMNESNARLIPGTTENTKQPFFSPDGESIGYWSTDDNQLKRIPVEGGEPMMLYEGNSIMGYYHWGMDGNIYYAGGDNGIMRISENGGDPKTVIPSKDGEIFFSPQLLPDRKSVMYTLYDGEEYKVTIQSLNSNDRKILFNGDTARYLKTGHLIYILGNDLKAVPFDINKLKPTGEHFSVVENILKIGAPHFCISNSGTLAYFRNIYSNRELVWVDFDGTEEKISLDPTNYSVPSLSPEGDRVALIIQDDTGKQNIRILDIVRGNILPSQNTNNAWYPIWSPASQRIIFSSVLGNAYAVGIYQMSTSGTGKIEPLYSEPTRQIYCTSLSTDGKVLLCQMGQPGMNNRNVGIITVDEDPQWQLLWPDEYNTAQPQFSPDDQWIAYTSNKSGRHEIYVRSYPEVEKVFKLISTDGGENPLWSPNSPQLYYRNGDRVMAVTYDAKQEFEVGKPEVLFKNAYYSDWDIHPDSKKFLMMKETSDSKAEKSRSIINVIINWFEELREKVPVD